VIGESERYNDSANISLLPGFATLDLRALFRFGAGWTTSLKVDNVLDRRYAASQGLDSVTFESFDYLAAGRTFMASISYEFQR
jgi:vitamin B12 transporter